MSIHINPHTITHVSLGPLSWVYDIGTLSAFHALIQIIVELSPKERGRFWKMLGLSSNKKGIQDTFVKQGISSSLVAKKLVSHQVAYLKNLITRSVGQLKEIPTDLAS